MSERSNAAVRRVISDALTEFRKSQRAQGQGTRRHPADVTADRLGDASTKWDFTGAERDAIATVVHALREIASGDRREC